MALPEWKTVAPKHPLFKSYWSHFSSLEKRNQLNCYRFDSLIMTNLYGSPKGSARRISVINL
jgi:hypothetical protein